MRGQCMKCGEMTEAGNSCCGAGVDVEGHIYYDEDIASMKLQTAAKRHADKIKEQYGDIPAAWSIAYDSYRTGWEESQ